MGLGDLDRRVTIQHRQTDSGTFGISDGGEWSNLAVVWAQVISDGGTESMAAGAETQKHTAMFRIRYRAGLGPEHRIVYRDRAYDIEDIAEPPRLRNRYLDIKATCREVKS